MAIKFTDPSKIMFTSDSHWGHANVLKYSNRPFSSIEEHDEALIENWNRVVPKDGIVFHLGDIFLCNQQEALKIRARLNGQINLLVGNHDKTATSSIGSKMFGWVKDYVRIKVKDEECETGWQDICLFHYPIASWEKRHYKSYMCHGHSHGGYNSHYPNDLILDVGVDNIAKLWDDGNLGGRPKQHYEPISYELVKKAIKGNYLND